jgi:hypothetical protein
LLAAPASPLLLLLLLLLLVSTLQLSNAVTDMQRGQMETF